MQLHGTWSDSENRKKHKCHSILIHHINPFLTIALNTYYISHGLISYIDDNAFIKHVFSGFVCNFTHLPLSANECVKVYLSLSCVFFVDISIVHLQSYVINSDNLGSKPVLASDNSKKIIFDNIHVFEKAKMKSCERFWNSNLVQMLGHWQVIKVKPFFQGSIYFSVLIFIRQNVSYLKCAIRKYQSIVITVCIEQFWWNAHIPF